LKIKPQYRSSRYPIIEVKFDDGITTIHGNSASMRASVLFVTPPNRTELLNIKENRYSCAEREREKERTNSGYYPRIG